MSNPSKKAHSPLKRTENQVINNKKQKSTENKAGLEILSSPEGRVVSLSMCAYCFDVLRAHLFGLPPPPKPTFTNEPFAAFVTYSILLEPAGKYSLRGCLGQFQPQPLHQILHELAIDSATKDSRFRPIEKDEFAQLSLAVSLLTNFEPCAHAMDWTIAVHGLSVVYRDHAKGRKYSATYLPQVALEAGWTQEQTIESLFEKGGFRGEITQQVLQSTTFIRYQSEKLSMSHDEYLSVTGTRQGA